MYIVQFILWAQLFCVFFGNYSHFIEGQGSTVGLDARHRLDFPGVKSRWGGKFFAPAQTHPVAHPARGTDPLCPALKRPVRGFDHPHRLAPKFKKE